jgi:hypothetical protein
MKIRLLAGLVALSATCCQALNQCSDVSTCNVCSACCKAYLDNQNACNSCVEQSCLLPGFLRVTEMYYNASRNTCTGASALFSYPYNQCDTIDGFGFSKRYTCSDDGSRLFYTYWNNKDCSGSPDDHRIYETGVCSNAYSVTTLTNFVVSCIVDYGAQSIASGKAGSANPNPSPSPNDE